MKVKHNTTVYQCDYCKKNYVREKACIKHENMCNKNPENIPKCWGCIHLKKETFDIESEFHPSTFKTWVCKKTDESLMPITSSKKGTMINYEYTADKTMPKECDEFIDKINF